MTITSLSSGRVTWTNITHPTPADIHILSEHYPNFHPLNLQDCLTELEFPKLDHHDDYLFLVVQIPLYDERLRAIRPVEIDIFIASGTLVTSHRNEISVLNDLFNSIQHDEVKRTELMKSGASPLLYHLLSALVDHCYPLLYQVDRRLRHIEQHLFTKSETPHILNEIALARREIITMRRTLNPQVDILRGLVSGSWPFIHEDLDLYWGDICDHLAYLKSMLEEDVEVVTGLSDTVDTLASHRIDEVVRVLTIVTVLSLPLTLMATVFGMNVRLPYGEHPGSFFFLLIFGVVSTMALIWYFHRRGWL